MKHLVMGTAGHVDHGKTALVKALTGFDCDTHKEEKKRGITIHCGFTHLVLDSGNKIGVVDVPGHSDFVHTMVGGASGIDFVLLVIAADSGVMPQTREHLQIMSILGIQKGLVAISKIDLADPEVIEMTEEEIRDFLKDTFFKDSPVLRISSKTKEGISLLKDKIACVASEVDSRPCGKGFKMYIDRIFTVQGFGTVATGSVIKGKISAGKDVFLLPGEKKLRVRRIERYGEEVMEVMAGDRAAINLVGLNPREFKRGMLLSDIILPSTNMIDVKLRLFNHTATFNLWNKVIFHIGTYEQQARVHLIDCEKLTAGNTALAQISLDYPGIIQYGERFVIRNTSSNITLGGGEVIDAFPLHHRKRPEKLIKSMQKLAGGQTGEIVFAEVRKRCCALNHLEIAVILDLSPDKIIEAVSKELPEDMVKFEQEDIFYLIAESEYNRLKTQIVKNIEYFHKRNPLTKRGRTTNELLGILRIDKGSSSEIMLKKIIEKLVHKDVLKKHKDTWALYRHSINIEKDLESKMDFIEKYLIFCKNKIPLMSELIPIAKKRGISEQQVKQILNYLTENNKAYLIEENYIHADVVDRYRDILLKELSNRKDGLSVAGFRDLIGGNRKICLLLLNLYDSEGVTERMGDVRIITKKGIALVQ